MSECGCRISAGEGLQDEIMPGALYIEYCPLHASAEKLRDALQMSIVALDDWLNIEFYDFCDEKRVAEARERVHECGTIAYIARVQDANETALAAAKEKP